MLTQEDINFIKANRAEIIAGRTEPVLVIRVTPALDPYTKEPGEEGTTIIEETVNVIWEEYSAVATVKDYTVVKGVDLRRDTALVSFDISVDLTNVKQVKRLGVLYEFLSINEKGLGDINRIESVVRRVY